MHSCITSNSDNSNFSFHVCAAEEHCSHSTNFVYLIYVFLQIEHYIRHIQGKFRSSAHTITYSQLVFHKFPENIRNNTRDFLTNCVRSNNGVGYKIETSGVPISSSTAIAFKNLLHSSFYYKRYSIFDVVCSTSGVSKLWPAALHRLVTVYFDKTVKSQCK